MTNQKYNEIIKEVNHSFSTILNQMRCISLLSFLDNYTVEEICVFSDKDIESLKEIVTKAMKFKSKKFSND